MIVIHLRFLEPHLVFMNIPAIIFWIMLHLGKEDSIAVTSDADIRVKTINASRVTEIEKSSRIIYS